jgi:hypothetical protein
VFPWFQVIADQSRRSSRTKNLERSIHSFSAARGGARLRIAAAFLSNISDKQNKKRKAALDWYAGHGKIHVTDFGGLGGAAGLAES